MFTKEYFELLRKFGHQHRDYDNAEQNYAYEQLKQAYLETKEWANKLKNKRFPKGVVRARSAPTNQGQTFNPYTWARIYPEENAPINLAFTVGISAENGFIVKIDTYKESYTSTRLNYEKIRGDFTNSTIVSLLPEEEGLKLSWDELILWSENEIEKFDPNYNMLAKMLGLTNLNSTQDENSNPDFEYEDKKIIRPTNLILYGPPGTGKTYEVSKRLRQDYQLTTTSTADQSSESLTQYSFVTFHQSYGYEEFVEGLRPILNNNNDSASIKYEIRSGIFKELCCKARVTPDRRFAMVIDEINRGNISKIFGELITLIEPDKREGAENAISVILPYSGEIFSVPPNVDIIGTMNTADKSLSLLDTALRRRFDFQAVMPDVRNEPGAPLYGLSVNYENQIINIPQMLSVINQRIEALYNRDHCIGHAYFTSLKEVPDGEKRLHALSEIFRKRIIPLLEEYFFEDWQKIQLVLADNQKPEAAQFVSKYRDHNLDLVALFGNDHGLDAYATKQRYVLQDASFTNPTAYIGIYQPLQA